MITIADKGNSMVALDRKEYIKKMSELSSDEKTYKKFKNRHYIITISTNESL